MLFGLRHAVLIFWFSYSPTPISFSHRPWLIQLRASTGNLSPDTLGELRLQSECLPMVDEVGYTQPQRYMHFLWDALDKLPISIIVGFSIPLKDPCQEIVCAM